MSEWPQSWAAKNSQYLAMVEQLNKVKAASSTVTIHSAREPIQSEWEAAYIKQIGQELPIQPGCKLLWFDVRNNLMRLYQTSYDVIGSLGTTGIVRRAISESDQIGNSVSGQYRMRESGHLANVFVKGDTIYAGFLLDANAFANRKNLRFKAFMSVNMDDTIVSTYAFSNLTTNMILYLGFNHRDGARLTPITTALNYRSWRVNFIFPAPVPTFTTSDDFTSSTPQAMSESIGSNRLALEMMMDIVMPHDQWGGKWTYLSGISRAWYPNVGTESTGIFGLVRRNTVRMGELTQIYGDVSPSSVAENRGNPYLSSRGVVLSYATQPYTEMKEFV